MIQSIRQSYDFKKFLKKAGGGSSDLEPRVQELELEVSQLSASVLNIWGAVEHKVDDEDIAWPFNSEHTTAIPVGQLAFYEGEIYRCKSRVNINAGAFDSTMWDIVPDYDETQTYNTYDFVVYDGKVWRCDESSITGEWDPSHWTDVTINWDEYDPTSKSYNASFSNCIYEGDFYTANATYQPQGTVGAWEPSKWDHTSVEREIDRVKVKSVYKDLAGVVTDEYGLFDLSALAIQGNIIEMNPLPYGGQLPMGTNGYIFTRINRDKIMLESITAGVRAVVANETLTAGQYGVRVIYSET